MELEPILQMGTDVITLKYAYNKPFKVRFPDRYVWQNRHERGLVWVTDRSVTNEGTGAELYR
jgi:transposase